MRERSCILPASTRLGRESALLVARLVHVTHLSDFQLLKTFLCGPEVTPGCLRRLAEIVAFLPLPLLLVELVIEDGLEDVVAFVLVLQALRDISTIDFAVRVLMVSNLLTCDAMRLLLQLQFELAEVGGGIRGPVPASRGECFITTDTLVDRVVSDRVYSIVRGAVYSAPGAIVLVVLDKALKLRIYVSLTFHDLLDVLDARMELGTLHTLLSIDKVRAAAAHAPWFRLPQLVDDL